MRWTTNMVADLVRLYPTHTNREIAALKGWDYSDVMNKGKNLGLKKLPAVKSKAAGVTPWTNEQLTFLKNNFSKLTNKELASALGYRITVVRNKTRELGLSKFEIEYWSDEMISFLKSNYQTLGDMEILHYFNQHHPKKKGWRRFAIGKKRKQLGLHRTPEEIAKIVSRNVSKGGPSFTIEQNSSSKNMADGWVANLIAWRDPELKKLLLKHPDLIELKRNQIKLSRAIKEVNNAS